METNWAAEHLQVIRTLMERAAVYRRALGPVMLWLGGFGAAASVIGWLVPVRSGFAFGFYWLSVSVIGVCAAYLLVRRQALKAAEPFWSPPTRRVTQAVMPPLVAGLLITVFVLTRSGGELSQVRWLPPIWIVLYGCAVHAAGFFMPRGMKLFGWGFLAGGCVIGVLVASPVPSVMFLHMVMGTFFGGLHLAYGTYLCFTEQRK
jgi:hypothetical protein